MNSDYKSVHFIFLSYSQSAEQYGCVGDEDMLKRLEKVDIEPLTF